MIRYNEITLRPVTSSDLEKMRTWRNSDWARSFFLTNDIISEEQQIAWYESYLKKTDDYMFIIQLGSIDVGTAALYRVDYARESAEFGRLLIAEDVAKGKSLGEKVLKGICNFAFTELKLREVALEVFALNTKAVYIYEKVGFKLVEKSSIEGKEVFKMVLLGEKYGEI